MIIFDEQEIEKKQMAVRIEGSKMDTPILGLDEKVYHNQQRKVKEATKKFFLQYHTSFTKINLITKNLETYLI